MIIGTKADEAKSDGGVRISGNVQPFKRKAQRKEGRHRQFDHIGLKNVDEQLGIRIVRAAIDRGINFMDNSWDYNGGENDDPRWTRRCGNGYRDKVFLMTKIDGRSKAEATRQLEESLRRLQTECIDLVQHHEVIRYDDPHRIFDDEGANVAARLRRARPENSTTSALPATRTRTSTSTHLRWPASRGSSLTQCRCRLTSWMPTTGASRNWSSRS